MKKIYVYKNSGNDYTYIEESEASYIFGRVIYIINVYPKREIYL